MPGRAAWADAGGQFSTEPVTLTRIEEFIAEQRSLTAVSRFTQRHENARAPVQERYYRDLIPLETPSPGRQYAFEVDLDKCSGCKACVSACHSLNGLDEEETWRGVGLLHGGSVAEPVQVTVTSACHHCVDPACLNGCPVLAYDKDPVTGIVRHLDDQCIGCQYCVLKCPYDVPKYSAKRGIVRKCDMCSSRLASGEAPACVQACPTEAIRITVVSRSEVEATHRGGGMGANTFLPGTENPGYTVPTTQYKTTRRLPENLDAADSAAVTPQPAHWPLVFMLVLTQLSVGALGAGAFTTARTSATLLFIAAFTAVAGIGVSVAHLGRPLGAWRAFLGWRKSWLSREILVLGAYMALTVSWAGWHWLSPGPVSQPLAWFVTGAGLAAIFCSVMVYHDTRREFWSFPRTAFRFFGTTLLLGAASVCAVACFASTGSENLSTVRLSASLLVCFTVSKLAGETGLVTVMDTDAYPAIAERSARLIAGPLQFAWVSRLALGFLGGIAIPLAGLANLAAFGTPFSPVVLSVWGAFVLLLTITGEILERYLFFTAVMAPKMPGAVPSS
jgi:formate dehydrogenase iron-sulfur subunit